MNADLELPTLLPASLDAVFTLGSSLSHTRMRHLLDNYPPDRAGHRDRQAAIADSASIAAGVKASKPLR